MACRVYLPARSLAARREAIESEGAEVMVVDGAYEDAVEAAALAGLRALQADPLCAGLRKHLEVGSDTRVLLIASEGITGAHPPARANRR